MIAADAAAAAAGTQWDLDPHSQCPCSRYRGCHHDIWKCGVLPSLLKMRLIIALPLLQ